MRAADIEIGWNLGAIIATWAEIAELMKVVRRNCQCHKMSGCPVCELTTPAAAARLIYARRNARWIRGEWSR